MSDDTPTVPGPSPLPSSAGIVAVAGHKPDPLAGLKALEQQAVLILQAEWQKKSTRDAVAGILYTVIGALFPGAAQSILLNQLKPVITTVIETGSK